MSPPSLSPRDLAAEARWRRRLLRLGLSGVLASAVGTVLLTALWFAPPPELVQGVIWQPTADYAAPSGCPGQIGARELVVQWTKVDQYDLTTRSPGGVDWDPDWAAVEALPWVRRRILGLAGAFNLDEARRAVEGLAVASHELAADPPMAAAAWYAPVEISPDWRDTGAIRAYLAKLPRPLWVSVYGGYALSDARFIDWVGEWLPDGVGLFYQDGVGVDRQSPQRAACRARLLVARFGPRVALVLEAFRQSDDRFAPAGLSGLVRQLRAYRGLPVYVFSQRHLSCATSLQLKLAGMLGLLAPGGGT
jgi:hypothetical protein